MFGSSDLFIKQLLALAECRLLKFSFRAWQKYCILSLLSLDRFSEGILINISSKKNAFARVFTPTIRHFETGLFKKSGKSGSARHPRGMKLGNSESFGPENICFAFLVVPDKCKKKGTIEAFRLFSRELFGKRL